MSQMPPPIANVPPMTQGALGRSTVWWKVIGIISIVLGSLGVLSGCWQTVSPFMTDAFAGVMQGVVEKSANAPGNTTTTTTTINGTTVSSSTTTSTPPGTSNPGTGTAPSTATIPDFKSQMERSMAVTRKWRWAMVASALLGLGASVILLFAGLRLVNRKQQGSSMHMIYAAVKAFSAVVASLLGYVVAKEAMAGVMASMPAGSPLGAGFMNAAAGFGVIFALVWSLLYPVFVLIWFRRPVIRAEVSQWPSA